MMKKILARGLMISMILGVFALGFLVGTVNQRYADAQKIPGVGDVLDNAGSRAGPLVRWHSSAPRSRRCRPMSTGCRKISRP